MDPPLEHADLARLAAAGATPEVEAMIAERFAGRIRIYGLRHLRSTDLAGDLVQEVLLIVLQALRERRIEDVQHIDRFILGTCRNVVGVWRRGERRRDALSEKLARVEPILVVEPPRKEATRVTQCLHALSERAHAVLVLTFVEERTAEEIAPLLELSPANVRVIRHRALQQVRQCVDRKGET